MPWCWNVQNILTFESRPVCIFYLLISISSGLFSPLNEIISALTHWFLLVSWRKLGNFLLLSGSVQIFLLETGLNWNFCWCIAKLLIHIVLHSKEQWYAEEKIDPWIKFSDYFLVPRSCLEPHISFSVECVTDKCFAWIKFVSCCAKVICEWILSCQYISILVWILMV